MGIAIRQMRTLTLASNLSKLEPPEKQQGMNGMLASACSINVELDLSGQMIWN
jgi:hypothetical protein